MIVHYRPIFIIFVSLALGLWVGELYYYTSPWIFYSILIVFAVLFLFIGLYFIFKKLSFFKIFYDIKIHLITIFIPFLLGFLLLNVCYAHYSQLSFTPQADQKYTIYGTIATNYIEKEKGVYFILQDASVIEGSQNTQLGYNVFVYVRYIDNIPYTDDQLKDLMPGNALAVINCELSTFKVFGDDAINAFAYSNGFQYATYPVLDDIKIWQGKMYFWDSVREYIRDIYKANMDERYAGLAFSILVGDRTELESDIAYNFQISGIMHVVAVSGLNTAFIMMLLLLILNVTRCKKALKLGIVIVVLIFYALLCKMTPSVVRASLMSVFLLASHLYGKQHDNLNSISLSGIILLLIYPLDLFDLGFVLSYLGVFGIFLLYKPILSFLSKFIRIKALAEAIALTLAATIATTPIIINAFGYVSIIGLLANLILVPLFGFAFMALFAITLLAIIIPIAGYLLHLVQYGFWVVDKGAYLLAQVPYAAVMVKPIPKWSFVGFYTSIFASSRYCVAKSSVKWSISAVCMEMFFVGLILSIVT